MKNATIFLLLLTLSIASCKKDRLETTHDQRLVPYENVIVMDSNIFKLKSTQAQLDAGTYVYEVRGNIEKHFTVDKIIIGYTGEGYLRKVTNVSMTSNELILQTQQATFEQAFKESNLQLDVNYTNDSFASGKKEGYRFPIPGHDFEFFNRKAEVSLDGGTFYIEPNFKFDIQTSGASLKYLNFGAENTRIKIDYGFSIESEIDISPVEIKKELWTSKSIKVIWFGQIPIVTVTEIKLEGRVNTFLSPLSASADVTLDNTISMGLKYQNDDWDPYFDFSLEKNFEVTEYPNATLQTRMRLVPVIKLKVYGLVGPYLEPELSATLRGNFNFHTLDKDLFAGATTELELGFRAGFFGFKERGYDFRFPGPEFAIYELPGKLKVVSGNNQSAAAGATLSNPIKLKVTDDIGIPSPLVNVYFEVLEGGGSVNDDKILTDLTGNVLVNWTLGTSGTQKLKAVVKKASGAVVSSKIITASISGSNNGNNGNNGNNQNQNSNPHFGKIYNMDGDNPGAWDLVNHQPIEITAANSNKDMANTTPVGTIAPDFFLEFKSLNGTKFSAITSSLYQNTNSYANAASLYNSLSPNTSVVSNLRVGNCYIAKIRNSNKYAVIKITNIVETPNDDLDYISFEYKYYAQ